MTLDDALKNVVQAYKHMDSAKELADRVLAETPRTEEFRDVRRACRYIQSGVNPPAQGLEEAIRAIRDDS